MKEWTRHSVLKWSAAGGAVDDRADDVAIEEPLEIRVAGQPIAVTMRTPGHDAELAAGFLWSEDILTSTPLLRRVSANVVNAALPAGSSVDLNKLTRHVFASSSCGLCGKATIDSIRRRFPPVEPGFRVDAALLSSLPDRMRAAQRTFARTGGLHAAALFNAHGELLVLREDVGRHNAVDKVVGHALLGGRLPLADHLLLVSGRASFEIVQKALCASLPLVLAVSAPSSLAIELADECQVTLAGFARDGRLNVYTAVERIVFPIR